MEKIGNNLNRSEVADDAPFYRALLGGDLPAAFLLVKECQKSPNAATAFNCGLVQFLLEEWEKSLSELKRAEQTVGNPPEYDVSERRYFIKSLENVSSSAAFLPLDPNSPAKCDRYRLIRIRWLIALCLQKLGRETEAAPIIRFLSQYNIHIS